MTQEVKMLVGIPGAGKSTWAHKEVERLEEEHLTTCVISRDYVRESFLQPGENYFAHEDEVFNEFIRQINEAMEIGFDVVFIDATHINAGSRRKVLSRLTPDPHSNLTFEVMKTNASTAMTRNEKRTGFSRIPNEAILNMAKRFRIPNVEEMPKDNFGFNEVRIVIHNEGED